MAENDEKKESVTDKIWLRDARICVSTGLMKSMGFKTDHSKQANEQACSILGWGLPSYAKHGPPEVNCNHVSFYQLDKSQYFIQANFDFLWDKLGADKYKKLKLKLKNSAGHQFSCDTSIQVAAPQISSKDKKLMFELAQKWIGDKVLDIQMDAIQRINIHKYIGNIQENQKTPFKDYGPCSDTAGLTVPSGIHFCANRGHREYIDNILCFCPSDLETVKDPGCSQYECGPKGSRNSKIYSPCYRNQDPNAGSNYCEYFGGRVYLKDVVCIFNGNQKGWKHECDTMGSALNKVNKQQIVIVHPGLDQDFYVLYAALLTLIAVLFIIYGVISCLCGIGTSFCWFKIKNGKKTVYKEIPKNELIV